MSDHLLFRPWVATTFVVTALAAWALLGGGLQEGRAEEKSRVVVPRDKIHVDDGDSLDIRWGDRVESVRILGIDTPEIQHLDHDIPYPQPFGEEARGFLQGCVRAARTIELHRSGETDPYGRTLAYLLVDGRNYSVLVIEARLAYGPSDRFGDNGFPAEFAACKAAAAAAGPLPFEEPYRYRRRMRAVTEWMKANGTYPRTERAGK